MTLVAERVDIFVYVNNSASPNVRNIAKGIAGSGTTQIHNREDLRKQNGRPSHIIIAGGEGTNLAATQWMFDRQLLCAVGFLGGGTHNVLFGEVSKQYTMTIDEFRNTPVDQFPKGCFFHPGQVGERVVFNKLPRTESPRFS